MQNLLHINTQYYPDLYHQILTNVLLENTTVLSMLPVKTLLEASIAAVWMDFILMRRHYTVVSAIKHNIYIYIVTKFKAVLTFLCLIGYRLYRWECPASEWQ